LRLFEPRPDLIRSCCLLYIGTRHQSHRSSHAVPHRIFDDVEERGQGERKRSLPRETTTSLQLPYETTPQPLYMSYCCHATHHNINSFLRAQIKELCIIYQTTYQTTHCTSCLLSRHNITCKCMRRPMRPHKCTCPEKWTCGTSSLSFFFL
jgi:hypothetical protein